jgi:hypothetical protein
MVDFDESGVESCDLAVDNHDADVNLDYCGAGWGCFMAAVLCHSLVLLVFHCDK